MAPTFSTFNYIHPYPPDERVWFSIPVDIKKGAIIYLVFPYKAKEYEIKEEEINVGIWTD